MALIIPEVFADAVNAKLDAALRIGRVAFDATPIVSEAMQYGDTVHFPKLKRVVTAAEVTKGTPVTPAAVDMTDMSAPIKQVAGSARVYDVEAAQIKGRVMDSMVIQVADAMSKKIDADLVAAMDADAVYKQVTAAADAITDTELMAGLGCFGDDVDTASFAGIIINSRLLPSFLKMDAFTSVEKTFNKAEQANGLIVDGVVGYFIGIPVIMCNNGTYDETAKESKTYIVKREALGYVFQRNINIEEERESKLLATDIIASSLYAVKLLEAVLDKKREEGLYRLVDFVSKMTERSEKFAALFSSPDANRISVGAMSGFADAAGGVPSNISNQEIRIEFNGDTYITGTNEETVEKHKEVTRQFANEIFNKLNIKR